MQHGHFSDSGEIYGRLLDFVNVEKGQATVFKLDRMAALAAKLGNPHLKYMTIHVAGSKGKGSVSSMIARILEAAGHRTGLYTSPHLENWKERISLAGDEMPEEILTEAADRVFGLVDGRRAADFEGGELPTFFELTTLIGFVAFELAGCSAAVIETGLGGRLDSTNIVSPAVSVITPIELEHTEFLGDTIELIAGEKAGIIKPGRPVCVSGQKPEAGAVFAQAARDRGCRLFRVDEMLSIRNLIVSRFGVSARLEGRSEKPWLPPLFQEAVEVACPLIGAIQAENMALAALAVAVALPEVSPQAVRTGLGRVRLGARFEPLGLEPEVIIDGAHTPASVAFAMDSLEKTWPGPAVLLFGCAHDKNHREMAGILAPHFRKIVVTRPGTFKQSEPGEVFSSFRRLNPHTTLIEDTALAVRAARAEACGAGLPLLVTGSFYLCAIAASILRSERKQCSE